MSLFNYVYGLIFYSIDSQVLLSLMSIFLEGDNHPLFAGKYAFPCKEYLIFANKSTQMLLLDEVSGLISPVLLQFLLTFSLIIGINPYKKLRKEKN